jgi:hypothetical protein
MPRFTFQFAVWWKCWCRVDVSDVQSIKLQYQVGMYWACCCSESHLFLHERHSFSIHVHSWSGDHLQVIHVDGNKDEDVIQAIQYLPEQRVLLAGIGERYGGDVHCLQACKVSQDFFMSQISHFSPPKFSHPLITGPKYMPSIKERGQYYMTYCDVGELRHAFWATCDVRRLSASTLSKQTLSRECSTQLCVESLNEEVKRDLEYETNIILSLL